MGFFDRFIGDATATSAFPEIHVDKVYNPCANTLSSIEPGADGKGLYEYYTSIVGETDQEMAAKGWEVATRRDSYTGLGGEVTIYRRKIMEDQ